MATKVITLQQFAGELQELTVELEKAIVTGLRSAAARGVSDTVEAINTTKPYPAVDRGELARSVEYSRLPKGGRVSVDAPHAAVVEEGARPFWPPLEPLVEWAKRKFGVSQEEAEQIARNVQRKIGHHGIAPRHYFRTAFRVMEKRVPVEVERELAKI